LLKFQVNYYICILLTKKVNPDTHISKQLYMGSTIETLNKRAYSSPQIEQIKLDNEISLQLQSDAPVGPGESFNKTPEHLNNDPFKNTMA